MKLTDDFTLCESLPDWSDQLVKEGKGKAVSFGHTVISRIPWNAASGQLPEHDVLHFAFSDGAGPDMQNETEYHFARILQIGAPAAEHVRLPGLRLFIEREHFDAVVREHFVGQAFPTVHAHIFLRGTPHGRGLYALAAAMMHMVEEKADLLSRYCLEIALIKAIALAPPSMIELQFKGETWGPMLQRIEQAADFMIHRTEEPFQLAAVAAAAGCSERTLNEAFQRYLKITPLQFHRQCRLEAAYADLTRGQRIVTETAYKYGFENLGRFARAFRERFGINPSEVPVATSP